MRARGRDRSLGGSGGKRRGPPWGGKAKKKGWVPDWDQVNTDTPVRGYVVSVTGGGKFRRLHRLVTGCPRVPGVHYKHWEHDEEWENLNFDEKCKQCWPEGRKKKGEEEESCRIEIIKGDSDESSSESSGDTGQESTSSDDSGEKGKEEEEG